MHPWSGVFEPGELKLLLEVVGFGDISIINHPYNGLMKAVAWKKSQSAHVQKMGLAREDLC